jgi:hypothetical protein
VDEKESAQLLKEFGEKIFDRNWRLKNLYWVVNAKGKRVKFKPNWAQILCYAALLHMNVVLKVRQIGITTGFCVLWLDTILFNRDFKIGVIADTADTVKSAFRDKVLFAYDNLPEIIRRVIPYKNRNTEELILENGSSITAGVSFMGGTLQILHISEYGTICAKNPDRAEKIRVGSMSAVHADGIIVIESTALGTIGHFKEICDEAQKKPEDKKSDNDWSFTFLPWYLEPTYTLDHGFDALGEDDQIDRTAGFAEMQAESKYLDEKAIEIGFKFTRGQREWYIRKWRNLGDGIYSQFPSTPDEAFRVSTIGAYYASQMMLARKEGRITKVMLDPSLPVQTWWDIGNDTTAIWFAQLYGNQIRLIDYYANAGVGMPHYAQYIATWRRENNVPVVTSIGPHDLVRNSWDTGDGRMATAASHGLNFEVVTKGPIPDRIDAVRKALARCVFDEIRCEKGILALESYRATYNPVLKIFSSEPLHNWASHPADSFGYGIQYNANRSIGQGGPINKRLAPEVRKAKWR